ncbi:MAG: aminotransferase class I/II-fold pyridoxal phosphate-dependent enzyme, partial [Dehalococcoidia bacterium]|nr:aminotransferase class I/II-fold pyridoxal phosphate-dependent enzyme [Dehalococcoidia bacterium]
VVPVEEIDKLVAGLAAYPEAIILSDEVYSWILYGGRQHVSLLSYPEIRDRLILLEGWSKTYAMTGWRIGYGIFPPSLFAHAERLAVNSYSCVNAATQHAAIAALEGPDDDIHKMVKAFDERRELIVRELNNIPGVRCADPGGAFYAFPNIEGTGFDSQTLQKKLLEESGVAVVSGTSFGAMGQGYLRLSYAASSEEILEATKRIRDLLS